MTALHLCGPSDLDRLAAMALRRAEEAAEQGGAPADAQLLREGLAPLCDDSAWGAAYLFGPARAPVGYILLSFGWSVALAAHRAQVADMYIRPSVRGRGLGSEALLAVGKALGQNGCPELDLRLGAEADPRLAPALARLGFADHGAEQRFSRAF